MSASDVLVIPGAGVSFLRPVWCRLILLQSRGVTFHLLPDEHFEVEPADLVTPDDLAFLRAYRPEAYRLLTYEAATCH